MIPPGKLSASLKRLTTLLDAHGETTWQRVSDWTHPGRMPTNGTRGGGLAQAVSDEHLEERNGDRIAARYHQEVTQLAARLDTDIARLTQIIAICCPARPKHLANRDVMAAQVAADGWCVSCWRNGQHLEPVVKGQYRDRCRFCGDWRGQHHSDPPALIMDLRHAGRRITQNDVDRALGKMSTKS